MSTETVPTKPSFVRRLQLHGEDWLLSAMLAVVYGFALAGAFTHMHDWTIVATNEALRAYADRRGWAQAPVTPDWIGWANAVTSEIMPTAGLLYVRKRQRYGRPVAGPLWLFVGSLVVSLMGQLASVGVRVPGDAYFLACLGVFALTVLALLKASDMSYAREHAIAAEAAAERKAELAAERRREATELAAELDRTREREAAELAAELRRTEAEQAAELERQRIATQVAAEERRARIEADAVTERVRIEAAERAAEREARERQAAREADAARAVQVERARVQAQAEADRQRIVAQAEADRVRAEAARVQAEADAKRQAAALLASRAEAPPPAAGGEVADRGRARRPRAETAAAVKAVLMLLPSGTDRPTAVAAVVQQLSVTPEYARQFVPPGFVAGSSDLEPAAGSAGAGGEVPSRRHLTTVGSG